MVRRTCCDRLAPSADAEGIAFAAAGELWGLEAAAPLTAVATRSTGEPLANISSQGTWAPSVTPERLVDHDCIPGGEQDRILGYRTDQSVVDSLGVTAACGTQDMYDASMWITRTQTRETYRPIPRAPRPASTYGATGATWCAPSTARYDRLRIALNGDTVRVMRDMPSIPVSAAERDSAIAEIEARGPTGLDFSRIPFTKPAINRLTVDDQNRLWVRRDRAEGGIVFDIIEPDGTIAATALLGEVRTPVWSPFVVRGDVVLMVIVDDDDVPQVGRFVIEGGG